MKGIRRRRVNSIHRNRDGACEALEARRLLASLFDYVGLTALPAEPGIDVDLKAAKAAAPILATDSRLDLIWLANHVDTTTLGLLEKADSNLAAMYAMSLRDGKDFTQVILHNTRPADAFLTDSTGVMVSIHTNDAANLSSRLKKIGLNVAGAYDGASYGTVDVYTPLARIAELAGVAGVRSMTAQSKPQTAIGSVQNEWRAIASVPQLVNVLPWNDGAGITVGVMSDSIDQVNGGIATSQATGDLPPSNRINVLQDYFYANGTDEGRAMTELIYDIAPGANFAYHSAGNGLANFATGINLLQAAGADVIVDDLAYPNEPVFQDGIVAQAIDDVVNNYNVSYFSNAANQNGRTYYGTWSGGTVPNSMLAWDGASDQSLDLSLDPGSKITLGLQWSNPWGAATADFDLFLYNVSTNSPVASEQGSTIGGLPYSEVTYTNISGAGQNLAVRVRYTNGTTPVGTKFFLSKYDGPGQHLTDSAWGGPSVWGHNNSEKGFSVGAVPASNPSTIEPFSGLGGIPIMFNDDGTPIAGGLLRANPSFVAADGVSTSFFPAGTHVFYGTSAAAPNAAAIAALMQQAHGGERSLTWDQVAFALRVTAFDLGRAGYDFTYGIGRIDGLAAVIAADQLKDTEQSLILNQFGNGEVFLNLSDTTDIDSIDFSTDVPGQVYVVLTTGNDVGTIVSYYDVPSAQTRGIMRTLATQTTQIALPISENTRMSVSSFALGTLAAGSNLQYYQIDGPSPALAELVFNNIGTTTIKNTTISSRYDTDYYHLRTPANLITSGGVRIALNCYGGLNGQLTLFNAAGTAIATADAALSNAPELLFSNTLTANTDYYLRVGSRKSFTLGGYDLSLSASVPLAGGLPANIHPAVGANVLIPFGKTATSPNAQSFTYAILNGADVGGFFFGADAQLGNNITISTVGSGFDTVIAVYAMNNLFGTDGNGELIALDDDSGGATASLLSFTATPGVQYMLALTPYSNNIGNGQYVINVSYGGSPDVTPIPLNAAGDGSTTIQSHGGIPAGGEAQTYSFVTPANLSNGAGTITLEAGIGDGAIYLFTDAGVLVNGSYGHLGDETFSFTNFLVPGATYHLTVIPDLYAAAVTTATLRINLSTPVVPPTINLWANTDTGVFNDDNVTKLNDFLAFSVPADAGQVIRLYRDGNLVAGPETALADGFTVIEDTTGPIPDGDHTYTATIADNIGAVQSAQGPAEIVTIDTVAPSETYFYFDLFYNEDQVVLFNFAETVFGLASADIALQNVTTPGQTPPNTDFVLYDNGFGTYSYRYDTTPGNDRIPSGNYTISIAAGNATDLAGNGNIALGESFFFLDGDANHDRSVNLDDFTILAVNFGQTGRVFSEGNFDYGPDGAVNLDDFTILAAQFGKALPAPGDLPRSAVPALLSGRARLADFASPRAPSFVPSELLTQDGENGFSVVPV